MSLKIKATISLLALFIILSISSAGAAIIHDESIDGDLSSTNIGILTGTNTIIGSLDAGTSSSRTDGPDESDEIEFEIERDLDIDRDLVLIDIEIVALSLQSRDLGEELLRQEVVLSLVSLSGGLPNSVIIRSAESVVYARILPGDYSLEFTPFDNIGSFNYQFTITTSSSVPEPATLLLVGFGLVGLFGRSKKNFNLNNRVLSYNAT